MSFTALVVDDIADNRDLFRTVLEQAGYEVYEAASGKRGLEMLSAQIFDLLILDLQMPHVTGLDVLREIRAYPHLDRMAVVVVTANPHMITDEVETYAYHIMQKPLNIREFSQFVRRLQSSGED